jgi:hypothetical protein
MSDGVLAAIIAACATVFTAFLQIKASFAREAAARGFASGGSGGGNRRKSRTPFVFMFMLLGGSAVGGFALSQWLMERERSMKNELIEQLEAQVESLTRAESALNESRASARAEIEAGVLRKIGLEGVAATTTIGPCKPPFVLNRPALAALGPESPNAAGVQAAPTMAPSSSCTEAEAIPVMLCATVPIGATVTEVEVFMRPADSEVAWHRARLVPGAETGQARFSETPVELADTATTKQVCETFVSWSTEGARTARMLVRYTL